MTCTKAHQKNGRNESDTQTTTKKEDIFKSCARVRVALEELPDAGTLGTNTAQLDYVSVGTWNKITSGLHTAFTVIRSQSN